MSINTDYRVKVSLSKSTYETLKNDMTIFEIKKNENENVSGFINLLYSNYHDDFDQANSKLMLGFDQHIANYFVEMLAKYRVPSLERTKIENNMLEQYHLFIKESIAEKSDPLTEHLSFKVNKDNQNDFDHLLYSTILPNDTIASYFRGLFDAYSSKPQDIRETIIFRPVYEKIKKGIREKRKIGVKANSIVTILSPYQFAQTIEEKNNYLIGIDDYDQIKTFKLCKIDNIFISNNEYIYNEGIAKKITQIIKNGAQYAFTNEEEIKVKLSKKGIRQYHRFPTNRPEVIKIIDSDIYVFTCARNQIFNYFFTFGVDALIIEPQTLKEFFIHEHERTLLAYKKITK